MPHAPGLAAELQKPPVMADAACHGSSHLVVPEDGAPARELEVRGDHEGLPLVALGHGLEEQARPVGVEGEEAELVYPQDVGLRELGWASSRSSDPASRARLRRMTSDDAVKNLAGRICWQHSEQIAPSMWVLPVPASPMSTRSSRLPRNASESRVRLIASELRV